MFPTAMVSWMDLWARLTGFEAEGFLRLGKTPELKAKGSKMEGVGKPF